VGVHEDTLSLGVGADTVILQFGVGTYFGLDPVGTRIWELMQTPLPVSQIVERLCEEYDVTPEECERSVRALLDKMAEHSLVKVDSPVP
jgi:hypothetical protein